MPSPTPTTLPPRLVGGLERLPISTGKGGPAAPLENLLAETGTTALVVLHKGRVGFDHYPNGGARERPNRCFSVTKSIASALVGLALGSGLIDQSQKTTAAAMQIAEK